jgi:hypothetical protein
MNKTQIIGIILFIIGASFLGYAYIFNVLYLITPILLGGMIIFVMVGGILFFLIGGIQSLREHRTTSEI